MYCSINHISKRELKHIVRTILTSDEWQHSAKKPEIIDLSTVFADHVRQTCHYCQRPY